MLRRSYSVISFLHSFINTEGTRGLASHLISSDLPSSHLILSRPTLTTTTFDRTAKTIRKHPQALQWRTLRKRCGDTASHETRTISKP
ncbi:hypothetical protein VTL71DRAFT_12169, partial [Oculimacula yallundae]